MIQQVILNATQLEEKIAALADGMAALVSDPKQTMLAGILTRGAVIAERVQAHLRATRGWELPLSVLDITLYRDDLAQRATQPLVRGTEIPCDIEGKTILLIDDVLFTGRTIRSAMNEFSDFGRPMAIRLGVLVDRGLREYPIQADFAALSLKTRPEQQIKVHLRECDECDEVVLREAKQ